MAELVTIARPYAEAAFRAAVEAHDVPGWSGMLRLAAAVAHDPRMAALLPDPKVSLAKKRELFHSVTAGKFNSAVETLVDMLIENHRAVLLDLISAQFDALKREHDNVLKARIVSAFAMSDADRQDLVQALAKKYAKTIEAEVVVDAGLIGGVRIEIGDEVIHASARDTLDKMALALAH